MCRNRSPNVALIDYRSSCLITVYIPQLFRVNYRIQNYSLIYFTLDFHRLEYYFDHFIFGGRKQRIAISNQPYYLYKGIATCKPLITQSHVYGSFSFILRLCGSRSSETYVTTDDEMKSQMILKFDSLTSNRAAMTGFSIRVQSLDSGKAEADVPAIVHYFVHRKRKTKTPYVGNKETSWYKYGTLNPNPPTPNSSNTIVNWYTIIYTNCLHHHSDFEGCPS